MTKKRNTQRRGVDDALVPLVFAAVVALALALVAAVVMTVILALDWLVWPWWTPFTAFAVMWPLAFLWRLTVCEGDRRYLLLYEAEQVTGLDLNRDGHIGEPEPVAQEPRLIYVHTGRREREQENAGDFRHFLRQCYDGQGSTWRSWENTRLPSGRVVTQPLWEQWTARLLNAGLAVREHPTATLALTSSYREALETCRELL